MPSETVDVEAALRSWEVAPAAARAVRGMHAAALNGGTGHALLPHLDDHLRAEVAALVPALEESTWTGPDVAFAYYVELANGRAPSRAAAVEAVAALREVSDGDPSPPQLVGAQGRPWVSHALGLFEAEQRREGREAHWTQCRAGAQQIETFQAAHTMLAAGWADMAEIVDLYTRQVVWYDSDVPGSRSATVTQAFGAVFLSREVDEVETVEHLVHEATHLELVARTAFDHLVENRHDLGASPFRRQPRPLGRVLHAGVVSARIARAYDRCIEAFPAAQRDVARERQATALHDLLVAMDTLRRSARWTKRGADLFASLERDDSLAVSA